MNKNNRLVEPIVPLLSVITASLLLKGAYIGPFLNSDGLHAPLAARVWLLSHCVALLPYHHYILLATLSWGLNKTNPTLSKQDKVRQIMCGLLVVASIVIEFSLQTLIFPKVLELSQIVRESYTGVLILGLIVPFISGGGGGLRVSYPRWLQWSGSAVGSQPSTNVKSDQAKQLMVGPSAKEPATPF